MDRRVILQGALSVGASSILTYVAQAEEQRLGPTDIYGRTPMRVRVSKGSTIAEAIRYGLNRWDGFCRFLDDGRVEMDSNTVERSIRPIAMPVSLCTSFSSI